MNKRNREKIEELTKAILSLEKMDEARNFLRDLLTEKELIEFGNRWQAAKMLAQKISYLKIQKETGLSSRTIARVAKWLFAGEGGYQVVLDRQNRNQKNNQHHTTLLRRSKS